MPAHCPLPNDVKRAVSFMKRTSAVDLEAFWPHQIRALRHLAQHKDCSPATWYENRSTSMQSAPSNLNVSLVAQLTPFFGLGAQSWLAQYIFGFPITGTIAQSALYPLTDKPGNPTPISIDELFIDAPARFKARATRPPHLKQPICGRNPFNN